MMRPYRTIAAPLTMLILACGSVAWARTWTSADGKYRVEAEMLGLSDGKVSLKRSDGHVVAVPLASLSQEDQEFARRHAATLKAAPTVETPSSKAGGESPSAAIAFAPRPQRKIPQTGSFTMTAKEGVSAELFARAMLAIGDSLKPDLAESIRSGKTKYISNPDGSDPSWAVYVPSSYDGQLPYGLLVYVNSGDSGGIVGGWSAVMDKHRLIWVGANKSGNPTITGIRLALAIDGVRRIRERYQIDPQRIYVSGTSGGGRICSKLMIIDSDLFTGGFPIVGCNAYRDLPVEGGKFYKANIQVNPRALKQAAHQNRFVFLTGEKDFNREETRLVYNQYKSDGFQHVTYLEVPAMGHAAPNAEWFEKGIVALDAPLAVAAKSSFSNAARSEKRGLLGAALDGYGRSVVQGAQQEFAAEARTRYDALRKQYDEEVASVEGLLKAGKASAARDGLTQLRRRWGKHAEDDARRLEGALRSSRG